MTSDILTRLQQATGPDRTLDADIEILTCPFLADLPRTDEGGWLHPDFGRISPPARYTDSIDASLALAERKLPGCEIELTNLYNIARCTLHHDVGPFYGKSDVNSLPLAILSALFSSPHSPSGDSR